jgi:glycine oxidase
MPAKGEEIGSMNNAEVVVVGGGAIGLGIAWRAAEAGLTVTVVDQQPGRGASWAAAGMLAPVTEVHYGEEALLRLNLASNTCYPDFVAALEERSGRSTGYRASGTLVVARDTDDNAELSRLLEFQQRLGLRVQRLGRRDCRHLEPALAAGIRGGILVEGDHQIDNRALVGALLTACERSGVRFERAWVAALCSEGERMTGVRLHDGRILLAPAVVLAAGGWSATIDGLPPQAVPPVRPVKGQLLHLRTPASSSEPPLATHNIRGLEVYLVPRADGRLVVGATVEERGFDTAVTAGAVYELLRAAYELLPGVAELDFVEAVAGLRPAAPDNAPVLGRAALEGLVLATGHYRNGILLTPVTAELIVELLVTGETPEQIAPFSPSRFRPEPGAAFAGGGGS